MSKCISNWGEFSWHEIGVSEHCILCGEINLSEVRARALEQVANSVDDDRYKNTTLAIPIFVETLRARAAKIREGKV